MTTAPGGGMFDFEAALRLMSAQTVLCVGDLMLDEFVYGEVERISPEAPAPVLAVARSELVVGGAGNVARNVAALGARCIFVAVVGNDDAGQTLAGKLRSEPAIEAHLVVDPARFREGLGSALVRAALSAEPGCLQAVVQTGVANEPAKVLYRMEGFSAIDEIEPLPGLRVARFTKRLR